LVGVALSVNGVEDVKLVSASWQLDGGPPTSVLDLAAGQLDIAGYPAVLGDLHIADPNLPTTLNVTVSYPANAAPADVTAIRSALQDALSGINAANENGGGPLTYGQLLATVPLPGQLGYDVKFVLTLESGLSQILAGQGDAYPLTPFERLAIGG